MIGYLIAGYDFTLDPSPASIPLLLFILGIWYLFQIIPDKSLPYLIFAIYLTEVFLGLAQLLGLHSHFSFNHTPVGTFSNSGPYGGLLAVCIPYLFYHFVKLKRGSAALFSGTSLLVGIVLLLFTMSRTAWLACVAGGICILISANNTRWSLIRRLKIVGIKKILLITAGFLLSTVSIFLLKPMSALGRLFIWYISLMATRGHLLFGSRLGMFEHSYAEAQVRYFAQTPKPRDWIIDVVGSPHAPFNEMLRVLIEGGICCLILVLALLALTVSVAAKTKKYGVLSALVAFFLFSLGSYPLDFPIMWVLLLLLIRSVLFDSLSNVRFGVLPGIKIIFSMTLICASLFIPHKTKEMRQGELLRQAKKCITFGEHAEADSLLKVGCLISNDPMFLNVRGRNYLAIGNCIEAENVLIRSTVLLPNRLYPYYLLSQLYSDSACRDFKKLSKVYNYSQSHTPKVNSVAVQQMKKSIASVYEKHTPLCQSEHETVE